MHLPGHLPFCVWKSAFLFWKAPNLSGISMPATRGVIRGKIRRFHAIDNPRRKG